jgi:hypothetical protein
MNRNNHGGVIGYGSLINPEETKRTLGTPATDIVPIKCGGYRRVFNNEGTWREMKGNERAVLNAIPDKDSWLNGVLIPFGSQMDWERYQNREEGYDLHEVDATTLETYQESGEALINSIPTIKIPVGYRISEDIRPIPAYLTECLEGARYWSDRYDVPFFEDFVETTKLADGTTLSSYLGNEMNRHR